MSGDLLVGEAGEPVLDRGIAAVRGVPKEVWPEKTADESRVACGDRVAHGAVDLAATRVPAGSAPMHRRLELGFRAAKLGLEHLPEEPVIAVATVFGGEEKD